jgi:hypothetical protein
MYIRSKIVFGPDLVSKHCLEFPGLVKNLLTVWNEEAMKFAITFW